MRMDRRAGLLASENLPTFEELFSTVNEVYGVGFSASTATANPTIDMSSVIEEGLSDWYVYISMGGSVTISHIKSDGSKFNSGSGDPVNFIWVEEDDSQYPVWGIVQSNGTTIQLSEEIFAGVVLFINFNSTYSVDIIDRTFEQGGMQILKYYLSTSLSSSSTSSTNTRYAKTSLASQTGIIIPTFSYSSNHYYGFSTCQDPLVSLGPSGHAVPLYNTTNYYYPMRNSNIAQTRSYTLLNLYENW